MTNEEIRIATDRAMKKIQLIIKNADRVADRLAAILDAVDKDYTDREHMTETGTYGRSRVVIGGIHNAREYLTSEFLDLLEEAQDALADYKKASEDDSDAPTTEGE